jgi:hypothetical protein
MNCILFVFAYIFGCCKDNLKPFEMTTETEFKFWDFNIWQNIAATGMVVSGMSHAGLHFADKQVDSFTNLYWIWALVFIGGTLLKYYYFKNGIETDHHHHHDH